MRGEVHILVYCPIDTLQWGSTHSALLGLPSTALVQGCLDCRNILNAWTVGEFFFWGDDCRG